MQKSRTVKPGSSPPDSKTMVEAHVKPLHPFFALSRTPHGILDMATPAFAVLVYLGGFPPIDIIIIGLITTFSGYTAVYALNDLVDYRTDQLKFRHPSGYQTDNYLDAAMIRHPLAQGALSYHKGMMWAVGWAGIAMIGAYLLNPVCILIFISGAVLEIVYCRLWRITPWRAVVSGIVKTLGAVAAIFAVDASPSPLFLILLFAGLFCWEIGGQNIPADWVDIEVDRYINAQTIPVRFGLGVASTISLISLTAALCLITAVFRIGFPGIHWVSIASIPLAGLYFLIIPGSTLLKTRLHDAAMDLFNRASYFPPVLLGIALVLIWSRHCSW